MPRKPSRRRQFDDQKVLLPYLRQSHARAGEQADNALSLDAQEAAMRERGTAEGYAVEPAVRDHDEDSESIDRPGLTELLARVRPGVTVAVEMWDRLGRGWALGWINHEIEKRGGRTISITQGGDALNRDLHGVLGAQYLDMLSDRLHSVTAARVQRGIHVGATPYGYDRPGRIAYTDKHGQRKTRHSGPLVPCEGQARTVARIFARWVAGDSLRRIALDLTADGIEPPEGPKRKTAASPSQGSPPVSAPARWMRPGHGLEDGSAEGETATVEPPICCPPDPMLPQWTPNTIAWMLKNPVYAGGVRMRGAINWDARHEPIVDRATFDAAQLRFARSVPVRIKAEPHWCEGLVRHSCGSRMLLNMVQRPGGGTYPSYRCSATARIPKGCTEPRRHIGAPLLDRAVRECLARDLAALLPVDAVIARADAGGARAAAVAERVRLDAERAALDDEYLRSRRAWLSLNEPQSVWEAEKARFAVRYAALDRRLAALPEPVDRDAIAERAALLSGIGPLLRHPDATGARLRECLSRLGVAVVSADGVTISYHSEFRDHIRAPVTVDPRMRSV